MTTGQLVFFSGVVLLGLTIITAIIFIVKKPQYIPKNAAYDVADEKATQKLRNGYPTNRLTVQQKVSVSGKETEKLSEGTVILFPNTGAVELPLERDVETVPLNAEAFTEVLPRNQDEETACL